MTFLHAKTALVTGASGGVGEALSTELLARGMKVVGIARSKEKLDQIAKECGPHFIPMVCDVACNNAVENLFFLLLEQNLSINIFFLNAGIAGDRAVEDSGFNLAKHHEIMNVNYFGVLNFVHHWMKNNGKRAAIGPVHFIVTSSVNALWAPPGGAAYGASKAAVSKAFEGLSASLYKCAQFSSIYCGPVLTKGLKGSLPFIWPAAKMAKYLADFAEGKKKRKYPSVFYYFVCHLLKRLPYRWISKWFGPK